MWLSVRKEHWPEIDDSQPLEIRDIGRVLRLARTSWFRVFNMPACTCALIPRSTSGRGSTYTRGFATLWVACQHRLNACESTRSAPGDKLELCLGVADGTVLDGLAITVDQTPQGLKVSGLHTNPYVGWRPDREQQHQSEKEQQVVISCSN